MTPVRAIAPLFEPEEIFRALGDASRMRLLQLLILEELNVSELMEIVGQPQSTVSRHLKALRDAGLVRDRRVGATALYSASQVAGDSDEQLSVLLMGWLSERPLPAVMRERLDRVIKGRTSEAHGFFNRVGRRWDELRAAAFGSTFSHEAFLSMLPREWHVADIGAGTGHMLPTLAAQFERVIAVEPAEAMLDCARQRVAQDELKNVDLRAGDLTRLPIDDQAVDLATAMLVLHHVASPNEAMREMFRILRPGGRVLIVEQQAHENQDFYARMQDLWWGFDSDDLGRRMAAVGFADIAGRRLLSAASQESAADSPPLFVLTARRPDR